MCPPPKKKMMKKNHRGKGAFDKILSRCHVTLPKKRSRNKQVLEALGVYSQHPQIRDHKASNSSDKIGDK